MIIGVLVKQVLKSKHGHNQPVNKSHKAEVGNLKPFYLQCGPTMYLRKTTLCQSLRKTQKARKLNSVSCISYFNSFPFCNQLYYQKCV